MSTMLLLLPLIWAPQEKRALEWTLEPDTVYEYDVMDTKTSQAVPSGFFLFASELRKDGGNRLVVDRYQDLAVPLLFQLPRGEVKAGHSWEHAAFFFHEASESTAVWSWSGPTSLKPIHAKGRYVFRKLDDELAWIDGAFELVEIRRDVVNNRVKLTITKNKVGTITTSVAFNTTQGVVEKAQYALDIPRAQERVFEKGEWRVEDRPVRLARRIELKEVVKLDPEKMANAVQDGLRKAGNWLRKQQKGSGEFGTARTMESDRVEAGLTGLAVRALLAAGAKTDDATVQKGLRSLRSSSGSKTPQSYGDATAALVWRYFPGPPWTDHRVQELQEAFRKNFPKEDLTAVRAYADLLIQLRDRKTGAWAPSSKRGLDVLNPITTRHAAEGLFHAHLAGLEIPQEIWRTLLDLYATSAIDEEDEVELQLEFCDGFSLELKKVFPASWRFEKAQDDPMRARELKGFAHSTLAVLEILEILRAAAPWTEGQRKSIDSALSKGLGWIQTHWTLRTPPPTEAAWSVQESEYRLLLMRVLTALGVKSISGCDWHLEGSYLLLREQFADGSWDSSGGVPLLDTACAMQFLAQAALRLPASK